jgi:hypothetical protein
MGLDKEYMGIGNDVLRGSVFVALTSSAEGDTVKKHASKVIKKRLQSEAIASQCP